MSEESFIVSSNAFFDRGGQGRVLRVLADALGPMRPRIYCRSAAGDGVEHVPASRVAGLMSRLPVLRRRRDWLSLADDGQFDRWVAKRLRAGRVFVGTVGSCSETLREAGRKGMSTVLGVATMHVDHFKSHADEQCERFGIRSPLGAAARRRILEEYAAADSVVVCTERARRSFLERGFPREKLGVAVPWMRLSDFTPASFDGSTFRVSFVGLIEPWKGFHYLLEAFAGLSLAGSELVLWGGSGSRAATNVLNEHKARNPSIHVRPFDPGAGGYGQVYCKTSVLVHPSLTDGFAFAVAEAMASGVPVIVTENTGAADLVREGENGYVVPVKDVGAIQERILHLYRNRDLLPQMGAKAREAIRPLTVEAYREQFLGSIAKAAGERAAIESAPSAP